MADIQHLLFVRHLRAEPTAYVVHLQKGRPRHKGPGLAFWFLPLSSALSEVPIADQEQPLLFHARTRDFQDVTVQATITYRFTDPVLASTRIDFGINPKNGRWNSAPLERVGGILTELCQQPALALIGTLGVEEVLNSGIELVGERVADALVGDARLAERGVVIGDVRVVAVRAENDLERALQTPTREQVQAESDRATFERRALAVERERAIAENEMQNQIELARREEELVAQHGANARSRATEKAEADRIANDAEAERIRVSAAAEAERAEVLGAAEAASTRLLGEAAAAGEAARIDVYRNLDTRLLTALALNELAANLPAIDNLTITPDLLTDVIRRFGGAA